MLTLHIHAKRDTGEKVPRAPCPHCHALLAVQWYCWHLCAAVSHMLAALLWLLVGMADAGLVPSTHSHLLLAAASLLLLLLLWVCSTGHSGCIAVLFPIHLLLCCVVRAGKERRESEKQKNRKERSSGRKGKEEAGCPKMESENVSSPFFLQTETKESDRQGHGRKKKRGRQVSCCRQRRRVAEKHTALSHIHTFFTGKGKRGGDGGTLTLSLFPCSFPPLPSFSPGWLAQQWIVKTKGSWHSLSLTRYSRSHIIDASRQP